MKEVTVTLVEEASRYINSVLIDYGELIRVRVLADGSYDPIDFSVDEPLDPIHWSITDRREVYSADSRDDNPKRKYGAAKAPLQHVSALAKIEIGLAMGGGAHKYGAFNYRDAHIDALTYLGASERHMLLWADGVQRDDESGAHHLGPVMACCAILIDAEATGKFEDNRPKTGLIAAALENSAGAYNHFCETVESKV